MEDLPLGEIAALVPEFCSEGPALGRNTDDDDDDDDDFPFVLCRMLCITVFV